MLGSEVRTLSQKDSSIISVHPIATAYTMTLFCCLFPTADEFQTIWAMRDH